MESNVITLKSSDDKTFQITITAVKKSNLFNDILNDYISETVFPLPDVNSQTLEKIIKYLNHYEYEYETQLPYINDYGLFLENINLWDKEFLSGIDITLLPHVINAANYMDIPLLLEKLCGYMSYMLTTYPIEQMRTDLGINNDYTTEEMNEMNNREVIASLYY